MSVPSGPDPAAAQAACCAVVVDEWVRAGVRHAIVCPGSRSTPMALALADAGLELTVRLDERSAGFNALGIGLATGRPAVVCVTSGTAAVELHPAVVEAHHARVPLIVCTADRPPELHSVGAPQTVEQAGLYGSAVRLALALDPGAGADWSWRSVASRLAAEAVGAVAGPGPVQLNLALREPLVAASGPKPSGRPGGRPWHQPVRAPRADPGALPVLAGRRGVVVAGGGVDDPDAVGAMADALGWPLLADPRSGCRRAWPGVVAAADAVVRADAAADLRPEVVVRLGGPWASRALSGWLDEVAAAGADQILVDPHGAWADPGRHPGTVLAADPGAWCRSVAAGLTGAPVPAGWRAAWTAAEDAAQAAIDRWAADQPGLCEPVLARRLWRALDGRSALVLASSMPVRDVEWWTAAHPDPPRVHANRGANGIDGVVSTAVGVAVAAGPTVALVGDLAFLHDLGGLVRPAGFDPPCTVVVADNGGGGIFSFLPQATAVDPGRFADLFTTPQAVDVGEAAAGLGVAVTDVGDRAALDRVLADLGRPAGLGVVRVRLPGPAANAALHGELLSAVTAAVDGASG